MSNQIRAITLGLSLAVMLLTMNAVNVSLAKTVNNIDKPAIHGETNTANTAGGSTPPQQPTTLPSGGVKINPGCNAPVGGEACGGKIIPIKPPTPTKPDGKCPILTNNTCIIVIHKTVVKHENTITPMPVVVVNGMQLQLLNCTIVNNNQVLCNFAGVNNGAVLH